MRFREPLHPGRSAVFGAGWQHDQTGMVVDRDYRAYAMVYLTAGGGFYADATGRQAVGPGDLLLVFPGLVHSYGPAAGTWTEVWIGFRGPLFTTLEDEGVISRRRPVLHPGLDEGLIARLDAIAAAVDRSGGTSDAVLAARVHLLLAELAAADAAPRPDGLVARARSALESDLRRPVDLPRLARSLGVGYDALRRAFHDQLGTTPGRWRQLRRIERAKELLAAGATLDEIATQVGFCDRFFLARQFRRLVGQPPGKWRRQQFGR